MFNKNVPKATKNTSNVKDEFDDFGDLDNWDSELDDLDFDEPIGKDRKPQGVLREGLTAAFKSALSKLGPSIIQNTRSNIKSIDSLVEDGDNLLTETKYLKEQLVSDLTPTLNTLKQTGRAINSKLKGTLPDTITDKLEKLFKEEEKEDDTRQEYSKEEIENNTIKESLESIFLEQAKYQDKKDKKEAQEKIIERSVESFRHDQVSKILDQIRINTASERLFRRSTYTAFLKKDLELKYKHLFVSKELLATQQASAKLLEDKLNILIKNSTLPDIQKRKISESAKGIALDAIGGHFKDYGTQALKKLINNVKTKAKDFTDSASMMTSMLSMLDMGAGLPMSTTSMVGDMAGDYVGDYLGGLISGKLFGYRDSSYIYHKGKLENNKKALDLMGEGLRVSLSNKLSKLKLSGGMLSELLSGANLPGRDTTTVRKTANSPDEDAVWDNASRTSLVYIIPQYLARILQQTTNLATGQSNPLLLYSPTQGKLVEQRQLQKDFTVNILSSDSSRGKRIGTLIGQLKTAYQRTNKVNKNEADRVFKEKDDAIKTVLYNIEKYGVFPNEGMIQNYLDDNIFTDDYNVFDNNILNGVNDNDKRDVAQLLLNITKNENSKVKDRTLIKNSIYKAYGDFISTSDSNYVKRTLNDYASFGYKDELGKLVDQDNYGKWLSISEKSFKEAFKRSGTLGDNASLLYGENIGRNELNASIREITKGRNQEHKLANAIFDYLMGDFSNGTEEVVKYAKEIKKALKDKGIDLKNAKTILPGLKNAALEGIERGKVTLDEFVSWIHETSFKELVSFKNNYDRIKSWFQTKNKEYKEKANRDKLEKEKQERELREKYYSTREQDTKAYDFLLDEDNTINISSPKVLSNSINPIFNLSSDKVVDAIKHFEDTFISYVDWQQEHNTTIPNSEIKYKKESKKRKVSNINKDIYSTQIDKEEPIENKPSLFSRFLSSIEKQKEIAKNKFNSFKNRITNKEQIERLAKDSTIATKIYNNILNDKEDPDPLINDVQNQFKDLKSDPKSLKEALKNIQKEFKKKYDDIIKNTFKTDTIARDIFTEKEYRKEKQKVDDIKVNVNTGITQKEEPKQSKYQRFKTSTVKDIKNIFRDKYVDVYSKEILTNQEAEPLIKAAQLERGECEFADRKTVKDSYSIDRPVFDRVTGRILIDKSQISQGIYNRAGENITKRSFNYRIGEATRKATEFTVQNSLKLAGKGIKLGMKSLLFGMGLYGKMYWMMAKLGWSITKGLAKGILNLKTAKLLGKGVLGVAKGAFTGLRLANLVGTRLLWGLGRGIGGLIGLNPSSKFMRGPEQGFLSKAAQISGITKTKNTVSSFIKDKYKSAKDLYGNTKDAVKTKYDQTKDFFLGEEDDKGNRIGGLVDDVKSLQKNIVGDKDKKSLFGRAKDKVSDFFKPINEESSTENNTEEKDKEQEKENTEQPLKTEEVKKSKISKKKPKKYKKPRKSKTVRDSRADDREEKIEAATEILDTAPINKQETKVDTVESQFKAKTPAERSANALESLVKANKKENKKGFFSKLLGLLTGGFGVIGSLARGLAYCFGFGEIVDAAIGSFKAIKGLSGLASIGAKKVVSGATTMAKGVGNIASKLTPQAAKQLVSKLGSRISGLTVKGLSGLSSILTPVLGVYGLFEGVDLLVSLYEEYAKDKPNLLTTNKVDEQLEKNNIQDTTGKHIFDTASLMDSAENNDLPTINLKDNAVYANKKSKLPMDSLAPDASNLAFRSDLSPTEKIELMNKAQKFSSIGDLSANFESGKRGSASINPNDNNRGASFGRWQINEGTGTFSEFLQWANNNGGPDGQMVAKSLANVYGAKRQEIWKKLAKDGKIQALEFGYIRDRKYKVALKLIKSPALIDAIANSEALQSVLWSCAVQHGQSGAASIFNSIGYKEGMSIEETIKKIYALRAKKYPREAGRYSKELPMALELAKKDNKDNVNINTVDSDTDKLVDKQTTEKINANINATPDTGTTNTNTNTQSGSSSVFQEYQKVSKEYAATHPGASAVSTTGGVTVDTSKEGEYRGKVFRPTNSNVVTSPFGKRNVKGGSTNHKGIDLRARMGEPIFAMEDGKVLSRGGTYGEIVIEGTNTKLITRYLHLSKILVTVGQMVRGGDQIGKSGGMGANGVNTYTPHLHFEILQGNKNIDPEQFLKKHGIELVRKGEPGEKDMAPLSDASTEVLNQDKPNVEVNKTEQDIKSTPIQINEPSVNVNIPSLVEDNKSTTSTTKSNTEIPQTTTDKQTQPTTKTTSTNPILDILRQVVPLLENINTSIDGVTKAVTDSSMEMTKAFIGNLPSSSSSFPSTARSSITSTRNSYSPSIKTPRAQIDVAKAS